MYDYIIIGAGLAGAVFARQMTDKGFKCLVIDKRSHVAGNSYSENLDGIEVHKYGAHIFHTNNEYVWNYINKFTKFNQFVNSPIANFNGEFYNLPFNMNTFNKLWGTTTPKSAKEKIGIQIKESGVDSAPKNLEEQAISLVGQDVYQKLIKGYTEKQWGKPCRELPASIITRLPVRFTYDNNYFNAKYQGIPLDGYTKMVENILNGIEVHLNVDYLKNREKYNDMCKCIFYTGAIDEYFDYCFGELEYRSLHFETESVQNIDNFQGVACVNYTDSETPFTRIIEHKHYTFCEPHTDFTVLTKEFPAKWSKGDEPYYPINDERNTALFEKYKEKSMEETNVIFGGRLGKYQYFDMDRVIEESLDLVERL